MLFDFSPLWRPQKITWIYRNPDPSTVIERIRSKSARKFVGSIDSVLEKYELRYEISACTEQDYLEWLDLYLQRSTAKHFDMLASPDWYKNKFLERKKVEKIFIYKKNTLLGGRIITISDQNIVRSAFKASIPFKFDEGGNASLGLILDYLYLLHYSSLAPTQITGGTSRNLFGIINSVGYLCFKLRMGYEPAIYLNKNVLSQSVDVPAEKSFFAFMSSANEECQSPELHYFENDGSIVYNDQELRILVPKIEIHTSSQPSNNTNT